MAKWLNTLRKKPRHVRDNIAFGVSFGFALVVCIAWFVGGNSGVVASGTDAHFFKTFSDVFAKQLAAVKQSLPEKPTVASSTTKEQMQVSAPAPVTYGTSTTASSSESAPRQIMIVTTGASSSDATTTAKEQ